MSNHATNHAAARRSNGQWLPGHSGNLKGKAIATEGQRKRLAQLRAAIAIEFPKQSAFEAALARQAVEVLERAERCRNANDRVRLGRLALQIISEMREGRKAKAAAKGSFNALAVSA